MPPDEKNILNYYPDEQTPQGLETDFQCFLANYLYSIEYDACLFVNWNTERVG